MLIIYVKKGTRNMVFSSLFFLYAFLPASLLVYILCPTQKGKNTSLLVFSLIFYAWGEPKYVLLLAAMSFIDWYLALKIQKTRKKKKRRRYVTVACVSNLLLIGYFKYAKLFCSLFGDVPAFVSRIALPIGISFYTFQLLTYVIDVYRREAEAQDSYWNVLLYASLFHQCIAGPIVRYQSVADELFGERDPWKSLPSGVRRFTIGLAKKVVLSNAMGALADSILLSDAALADASAFEVNLATLSSLPVLAVWTGVIAYSLQIYLDFSAYSDMAIGMGRMLGLHYLENFDYPYISRSVTEFWRRWHISLSSFFRDYVYIPLGGSRCSLPRNLFNLLVVWALTGLWHGASWNFLLWGLYFYVFLVLEKLFLKKLLDHLPVLSNLYLLLVVAVGWILFRNSDLRLAAAVFKGLWGFNGNMLTSFSAKILLKNNMYILLFSALASTPLIPRIGELLGSLISGSRFGKRVRDFVSYALVPISLLLVSTMGLVGNSYNPFIYFQF